MNDTHHDDTDMTGNAPLSKNVGRLSRAQVNARRAKVPRKGEKKVADEKATSTKKTVGGAKNGGERTVPANKAVRYYQAESQARQKIARKSNTTAKLRSSITPGTVLILLAGRFRGKRVVFLKQLASGLLLVSGPFKVNGVPLRRVNQAYVIATSTKIDVSSVEVRCPNAIAALRSASWADADCHCFDRALFRSQVPEKLNDAYFAKDSKKRSKGSEKEFFGEGEEKKEKKAYPSDRSDDQKSIDKALIAEISKTENLAKYLGSTFALTKGQHPHLMSF